MYELDARYVAGRRGRGRNKSPLSRMEPHRIRPATRLRRRNLTYRGQVLFRERAAEGIVLRQWNVQLLEHASACA